MRNACFCLIAGACLLLSACRIPLSTTPLSDPESSKVDERLIGTWEIDVRRVHEILGNEGQAPTARYRVQRAEGDENVMQSVYLRDGNEEDKALPMYVTNLGMRDYLSLASRSGESEFYCICRYELTDDDTGKLFLMNDVFIVDEIDAGKVAGKVNRGDGKIQRVMLELTTVALREYVLRHGETVFDMERPLACKRVDPSVAKE